MTNTRLDAWRKTPVTYAYELVFPNYTIRGNDPDGVLLLVQALQEGEPKSTDGAIFPDISELDRKFGAVRMSAAFKEPVPWYPDDSGEWVEVPDDLMEPPHGVDSYTEVEVLKRVERRRKNYAPGYVGAGSWNWSHAPTDEARIVAYKVVKP